MPLQTGLCVPTEETLHYSVLITDRSVVLIIEIMQFRARFARVICLQSDPPLIPTETQIYRALLLSLCS